jgi:hypothetical protein
MASSPAANGHYRTPSSGILPPDDPAPLVYRRRRSSRSRSPSASPQVRLANLISSAPYKSPDGYVHPPRTGRELARYGVRDLRASGRAAVRSPRVRRVEHPRPVVLPGEAEVPGGRSFAVWGTLLSPLRTRAQAPASP